MLCRQRVARRSSLIYGFIGHQAILKLEPGPVTAQLGSTFVLKVCVRRQDISAVAAQVNYEPISCSLSRFPVGESSPRTVTGSAWCIAMIPLRSFEDQCATASRKRRVSGNGTFSA